VIATDPPGERRCARHLGRSTVKETGEWCPRSAALYRDIEDPGKPTGRLRARLTSMTDQTGIAVIAVDPAYTSRWGRPARQKPLNSKTRKTVKSH